MPNNIDTYKVIWDSEEDGLLYGLSIVDTPANMYETIQLSEQMPLNFKVEDKKKKQLAGVVLIPGQKVRRYTKERGEFDVIFEADTIEKLAHNLFKGDYHKNSWYNHDDKKKVEGSTVVESWIITDATKDKATAMGFKDLPVGTWMCIMQLSDEAWEEYVESGKVKGFSIDSMMSLEKIEFKQESNINQINVEMKNYLKTFIKMLQEADKEEVKMITIEREDGNLEVESLEVGQEVKMGEDLLIDGEFVFEGMVYKTDSDGKISEMMEVPAPEEVEQSEDKKEKEKVEMTDEKAREEMLKLIDEDEEMLKMVKEKYSMKEEEAINMSIQAGQKDEKVKSQLRNQFLEEIESKDKEILELKAKLDKEPSTGKLKAKVDMKSERTAPLTGLEAIRNTINKNSKQ